MAASEYHSLQGRMGIEREAILYRSVVEGKREFRGGYQRYYRIDRKPQDKVTLPVLTRLSKKKVPLHFTPIEEGTLFNKDFCPENVLGQEKADHIHFKLL